MGMSNTNKVEGKTLESDKELILYQVPASRLPVGFLILSTRSSLSQRHGQFQRHIYPSLIPGISISRDPVGVIQEERSHRCSETCQRGPAREVGQPEGKEEGLAPPLSKDFGFPTPRLAVRVAVGPVTS